MNTSFWSQCQGLVRRLQKRRLARPREQRCPWGMAETLEARALLSSTPAIVADIVPGSGSSNVQNLVAIGSTLYFTASDSTHGQELWKTDGTPAGTTMVKDILPGIGHSNPVYLTNVNGTLYFRAYDGINGDELWKSDGTAAGTTLVKDINPGPNGSGSFYLTNVNGTLYFSAGDGIHGLELWKSNGTSAGTTMVKDIILGAGRSYLSNLTDVNGTLYFTVDDGSGQKLKLWKSDGTEAGTVKVSDTSVGRFTNVNGTLFFAANDGVNGIELWKSDGTAAGTVLVKDINPGNAPSWPASLTNVNGTLFFVAYDGTSDGQLWKSDGTAAGTVQVKDIRPTNQNQSGAGDLTNVNGTLYFRANNGVNGNELWKSDGTAAGTVMVKDIFSGVYYSYGSDPGSFTNVNGTLYFTAADVDHACELWTSDGTEAGTLMVIDIKPGWSSPYPSSLTNVNGTLFFSADDGIHGRELWALSAVPAPSLDASGFPATITAGSAGGLTITARNPDGTTNIGYLGTIHFTSTDPQAVLPADYTFTAADHGVHTFTAFLKTSGTQTIAATDPHALGMVGESISLVKPAAASTMTVGGFPSTTTAGVAGYVTVTLKDIYGNIASGYTGTVRFISNDPQAALPANYTFTASDAAMHTFSVTLKTAGTRSITIADTLTSALTATLGGITVNAGAASQFLISAPSSVTSGVPFNLTLTVKDAYGNVVTGFTGTVRFTSTDTRATLPPNYTFTATDQGVHTFTGLVLRKRGTQTITITDTLNSSLKASVVVNVLLSGGGGKGRR